MVSLITNMTFQACISTLVIRNMVTPFNTANLLAQACSMDDVLTQLTAERAELQALRER